MYSPVAVGRVHQLGDPRQAPVRVDDRPSSPRRRASSPCRGRGGCPGPRGGQQGLLDRDRVHGVAVDQEHAVGHVVAGAPQRVGVVPLLGLVVVHQGELDAVPLLERGLALLDRAGGVARRRRRPRSGRPRRSCAARCRGSVVSPSTGTSAFGSVSVYGRRRRPGSGCQHQADHGASLRREPSKTRARGARLPPPAGLPGRVPVQADASSSDEGDAT